MQKTLCSPITDVLILNVASHCSLFISSVSSRFVSAVYGNGGMQHRYERIWKPRDPSQSVPLYFCYILKERLQLLIIQPLSFLQI